MKNGKPNLAVTYKFKSAADVQSTLFIWWKGSFPVKRGAEAIEETQR